MPEGDTIFRTATILRRALLGDAITSVEAPSPKIPYRWPLRRLIGCTVDAVEPRGKHLLIRFSNGLTLHTHMRMAGAWHIYRPGEPWQLPRHLARVVLHTERFLAICYSAPTIELLSAEEEAAHPALANLGPDLMAESADLGLARQFAHRT